jgi:hypothetical protein
VRLRNIFRAARAESIRIKMTDNSGRDQFFVMRRGDTLDVHYSYTADAPGSAVKIDARAARIEVL